MDFLDEEKHKLSKHAALVQKIYEDKRLHPGKDDILNCIYELRPAGLASFIHQYWNEEDAIFGNRIRERFRQDFFETAKIDVLWKVGMLEIISGQPQKKSLGQED